MANRNDGDITTTVNIDHITEAVMVCRRVLRPLTFAESLIVLTMLDVEIKDVITETLKSLSKDGKLLYCMNWLPLENKCKYGRVWGDIREGEDWKRPLLELLKENCENHAYSERERRHVEWKEKHIPLW